MKSRSITIKDIAHKLDISTSTVSRALRNRPDVNQETKTKVMELAKKLNFEPNSIALSLVSKRSFTIGVVVPGYHAFFYGEAISGIEEFALDHNYHIVICNTRESYDLEKAIIRKLINKRVDGIIVSLSRETKNFDHLLELKEKNIPFVLFNRIVEDLESTKVCVDDRDGAIKAVNHLLKKGYKKIAHIQGPSGLLLSEQRKDGYLTALKNAGITPEPDWIIKSDFSLDSGKECTERLMKSKNKPDAIFCVCDEVAYGSITWLKKNGYKLPQQMGIVGFTGEVFAEIIEPALTTIEQPAYLVGTKAAELLIERINNPNLPHVTIEFKTSLIERNSA
jgi:DNA-binding LacI/PurR family transcriptional regulator